ncbi:MAG: SNARE associated protein [Candidatus Parvarchaeum acidiphilum ARMAN-4]|jgi:membrane protein DedA with SNARE-associated domain|uniref:SNARE associated protein n=1 Tax=Candidatus Parvarchaeum acidiphilum ARMAN-4 TaxID=662760 RepID=D2EF54_PARA4|nr:MAG: SNARE associated protein [Candidatus Parvarchaeum acidiphilum ARMAN-4]
MFFGLDQILAFLESNSYSAIFVLMFLESVILPIPSEVVLPFTGFLIAIGKINPYLGFSDAVAASILGSLVGFMLGYFLGIEIFMRYSKKLGFKDLEYEKGIKWIKKYGDYFAFFTKLLPAVRSIAGIICGAFKMDIKKFLVYSSAGILIWSGFLVYTGYYLSNNWEAIANVFEKAGVYVAAVFVLFFLIYIFRKNIASILRMNKRK